ncbi:hypothetical protein [Arcobacter sp. YIC-310]|uniref:hypothetical protein n=1 Tax=Arcobacter sp. YIC-310 TaxID=3376632 RepID=UPI003C2540E0
MNNKSSFIEFSLNLMLNPNLVENTEQAIAVKNKILHTSNSTLIDDKIVIPRNSDKYISSFIKISDEQLLYFVRERNKQILNIYLIKKIKDSYSLIKHSKKHVTDLSW